MTLPQVDNLLSSLTELRGALYYHYQFVIKETNGDPDEEVPRARDGRIVSQEGP